MSVHSTKEYQDKIQNLFNLFHLKKFLDAEDEVKNLIKKYPDDFLLENIYGVILSAQQRYDESLIHLKKAINLNKDFVEGYYNIGAVYLKLSKYKEAINYFNTSIDLKKDYFDAYINLAESYKKLNQLDESLKILFLYEKINKDNVELNYSIGSIYLIQKEYQLAEERFNFCIKKNNSYLYAYNGLGLVHYATDKIDEAVEIFNKIIKIDPSFPESYFNLGLIFYHKKKNSLSAIFFFKKAIELNPNYYDAYAELINCYNDKNRFFESINILEKIPALHKNDRLLRLYANAHIAIGRIEEGLSFLKESIQLNPFNEIGYQKYLFNSLYLEKLDFKKYFEVCNLYKEQYKKTNFISDYNYSLQKNNKINIGFISGDFREHSVGIAIYDVINFLSQNLNFELFAYYTHDQVDLLNKKFKNIFKNWRDVKDQKDLDVANLIKKDQIQILIDLSGYSSMNRMGVFINKPAPIQISWVGYLCSLGLKEIDYIIADPHVVKNINEEQFVEKIYKLPNIWSCFNSSHNVNINEELPVINNGYVTFGSFNNFKKINIGVIDVWSKILNSNQKNKIIIKSESFQNEQFKNYVNNLFFKNKVLASQLILDWNVLPNRKDLLQDYNKIDIALDTFPYNGMTTSFEALSMNVPVLTKSGDSFFSKCGESINVNFDMMDWISKDNDDYVNKAIKYSSNLDYLKSIKLKLKNNKNNKVFDIESFSEDFANALIDINNTGQRVFVKQGG